MSAMVDPLIIGGLPPRMGVFLRELQNARHCLLRSVRGLLADKLDAKPGAARNTPGSILAHLSVVENMFRRMTYGGLGITPDERMFFTQPSNTNYCTHYFQDEMRHTEQIIIRKHLLAAIEPEFNPYALDGLAGGEL